MAVSEHSEKLVEIGRISGLFGVRGWVKVYSYTDPRENILRYLPWLLQSGSGGQTVQVVDGRVHGKGIIAHLEGIDDRDAATALIGKEIKVYRSQLPDAREGEYYWTDLVGLEVITLDGLEVGKVDYLVNTGANDVLVVKGRQETLIPYISDQVVKKVDLEQGIITVDWDMEF